MAVRYDGRVDGRVDEDPVCDPNGRWEAEGLSEREKLAIDYGKRLVGPLGASWDMVEELPEHPAALARTGAPWAAGEVVAVR